MDLKEHIRGIPDFPKPGILFYDISTLLAGRRCLAGGDGPHGQGGARLSA